MALSTAEELTRKLEVTCRGSLLQTQDILFHGCQNVLLKIRYKMKSTVSLTTLFYD